MIKTLNMVEAGENVPFADERKKFSRMMLIEDIEEHPDFKALYKIDPEVLKRIVKSMKETGFDASQPVHVWLTEDDHKYLIDGYTRFTASKKAGITSLPVYEHSFTSFDETYKYVLGLQVNRRNLSSDELLRNVEILSKCEFVKNTAGYKTEVIAKSLGISKRTAERVISVQKNADEDMRKRIENNEMTVNQAYTILHKSPKKKEVIDKNKVSQIVSKIAYYVIAEIQNGFPASVLISDDDFLDAIENPESFEIPENDRELLIRMGVDEHKFSS